MIIRKDLKLAGFKILLENETCLFYLCLFYSLSSSLNQSFFLLSRPLYISISLFYSRSLLLYLSQPSFLYPFKIVSISLSLFLSFSLAFFSIFLSPLTPSLSISLSLPSLSLSLPLSLSLSLSIYLSYTSESLLEGKNGEDLSSQSDWFIGGGRSLRAWDEKGSMGRLKGGGGGMGRLIIKDIYSDYASY